MAHGNIIDDTINKNNIALRTNQTVGNKLTKDNGNANLDMKKRKSKVASFVDTAVSKLSGSFKGAPDDRKSKAFEPFGLDEPDPREVVKSRAKATKEKAFERMSTKEQLGVMQKESKAKKKEFFEEKIGTREGEVGPKQRQTITDQSFRSPKEGGISQVALAKRASEPSLEDISKLKPGESVNNFAIAKRPVGGRKRTQPFGTVADINQVFGSAAELAKIFTSKEFQERKAKGIRAGAALAGSRADEKALVDRMKAEASVIKDLTEAGVEEDALKGILERLQSRFKSPEEQENTAQLLDIDAQLSGG